MMPTTHIPSHFPHHTREGTCALPLRDSRAARGGYLAHSSHDAGEEEGGSRVEEGHA